jgi:glycosyltransferase involved in cell wall biosynthesis
MTKNVKIKVVWICHFANSEINKELGIKKNIKEFAPWISSSIELIKNRSDLELHIVAPYPWLTSTKEFIKEEVHYHLINAGIPLWGRNWPGIFKWDYKTNFKSLRKKISRIVNRINPDIVNLIGAENAYYSASILDLKDKYPTVVTIQGFVHLENITNINKQVQKRIEVEKEILANCNNFIYQVNNTKEIIRSFNSEATLFHNFLPISIQVGDVINHHHDYSYDFVFFARVTKEKGIEDLIKALSQVKKTTNDVKLSVIGTCTSSYLNYLKDLALEHNVSEAIDWLGFLPKQSDVHKIVAKSKITVLPTYNDIISGTIIESMYLKTPVIAYKTGAIPDLNSIQETLKIVEQNDIEGLSIMMNALLADEEYRTILSERAYLNMKQRVDNEIIFEKLQYIYQHVIVNA